jgi:hypothetical protein
MTWSSCCSTAGRRARGAQYGVDQIHFLGGEVAGVDAVLDGQLVERSDGIGKRERLMRQRKSLPCVGEEPDEQLGHPGPQVGHRALVQLPSTPVVPPVGHGQRTVRDPVASEFGEDVRLEPVDLGPAELHVSADQLAAVGPSPQSVTRFEDQHVPAGMP